MNELPDLHTLWIGPRLSWVERLCLTSWLAHGHRAHLWTYRPVEGVPAGVVTRSATEILPESAIVAHRETGSVALFSDRFRYNLMHRYGVTWFDTDVLLLRPLSDRSPYLFAWESQELIGTGVLRLPSGVRALRDLLTLTGAAVPVPPWWPPRKRARQRLRGLFGRHQAAADMPWGTFGPKGLTEIVQRRGLTSHVLPAEVFYPFHWSEVSVPFGSPESVETRLTDKTVAVHLWSAIIRERRLAAQPAGTWLAAMSNKLGVALSP